MKDSIVRSVFYTFLKIKTLKRWCKCMCVCVYGYVHISADTLRIRKRAFDALELRVYRYL